MSAEGWESTGLEVLRTSDFEGLRLRRTGLYGVCFAATWCPPTRRFVPKFVRRAGKLPGRLAMADITDLDDPLWDDFEIEITPTMAIFRDGSLLRRFDGRRVIGLTEKDLDRLAAELQALTDKGEAAGGRRP